jgi:hypothetical protein
MTVPFNVNQRFFQFFTTIPTIYFGHEKRNKREREKRKKEEQERERKK